MSALVVVPPGFAANDKELTAMEALAAELEPILKESESARRFVTARCLRRYVRARGLNVDAAKTMLLATLQWRTEFKVDEITAESVQRVNDLGTVWMHGMDKEGRPVLYMRPGSKNPYPADERIRFFVHLLENAGKLADSDESKGVEKLTWVLDFAQFGERTNDSDSRATSSAITTILQNHFPERLGRAMLVNPPWYFRLLFVFLTPFIDSVTRQKVFFIYGDAKSVREQLLQQIDAEQLAAVYSSEAPAASS